MKLISHRGNLLGKDFEKENTINQIEVCINKGFDVEIDVWWTELGLFLGHDYPQNKVYLKFLNKYREMLWIHCKNEPALYYFSTTELNYFWHQNDDFTLTSKNYIWTFPEKQINYSKNQIILKFDGITNDDILFYSDKIFGICSDKFEV